MHKCAYWNGEQVCRREFSFSQHEKIIFVFLSVKIVLFCEAPTKNLLQNWTTQNEKKY